MEYLIDQQPSLAVVLRQKIGSQNTHYVHGLRGIQSQVANSAWTEALSDGLGSVRGWIDGSQTVVNSANYSPYGVPSGTMDRFGFTGEMTDDNGLVYLRARYYDPNIGNFVSLDPFEGFDDFPMSLNGYSYAEGNPTNWTDSTGMAIIRIWAAAFIEWREFTFAHPFDSSARWHGDGRSWHRLEDFHYHTPPSSRVWWNVVINTDTKWDFSYADSGTTTAEIGILNGEKLRMPLVAKAPAPEPAKIGWVSSDDGCEDAVLIVGIFAESYNPLIFVSPPIRVNYLIFFDLLRGNIAISREVSRFPWHELHISIDDEESIPPMQQEPLGPFRTPIDLAFPSVRAFYGGENKFTPQPCKKVGSPSPKIIGLPPIIADKGCLFK